ncbi:methylosome protein 50 [Orussus abietinus]|uniref:methylosome protein 50 n=1 Tax=Orussus abietinus TaxID=222816 RepID=UPI0006250191|nr:methylosome protein 50 [Orussus abietinus]
MNRAITETSANLNEEEYRNMTPSERPPITDKYLQCILIYNDESALIGASSMTDRYWRGTVWFCNAVSDVERSKSFVALKTESGVTDAAYLGQRNKFIIGEDSGSAQIVEFVKDVETNSQELRVIESVCLHDDTLTTMSVFFDNANMVTGAVDCCIKVLDLVELIPLHTYYYAHKELVTCVNAKPKSTTVFASTSLDNECLMWDVRHYKPAQSIFENDDCSLTSVAWDPCDEHICAVGTLDGNIILLDTRKPKASLEHQSVFPRGIHKLLFHPEKPHRLAGCCDDSIVKICDTSKELAIVYKDDRHADFVRGLAWHNKDLITCSWDDTVLRHVWDS